MPRDKAHTIGGLPIKPKGTRAQMLYERALAVWEMHDQGLGGSEIGRRLGMMRQNVYHVLKKGRPDPNEQPPTISAPRLRITSEIEELKTLEPTYVPDTAETPEGSIGFLKTVQADTRVPITERIKCAIAIARLETAKEASSWTPPTDPTLWAEAMVDAFKASSPDAQQMVKAFLSPKESPKPMSFARPVSEEAPKGV